MELEKIGHGGLLASCDGSFARHADHWLSMYPSRHTKSKYLREILRYAMWCKVYGVDPMLASHFDTRRYFEFCTNPQPEHVWIGPKTKDCNKRKPFEKPLRGSSLLLCIATIRSFYRYLVSVGEIGKVPIAITKTSMSRDVLQKNVNARVFSKDMIDATKIFFLENTTHWNAFRFHRAKFAFECAMLLGLRIHEIAHGKMSCFQKMRGNWFFCLTGKGNKYAEIPCPNQLMDMLVSYRKVLWLSAYPSKDETTVLCPRGQSHLETSISDRQIYNELKYAFSEAATHADDETAELLKKASPHWLRHGYVSHQVAFGIPITEVMENARHSDIKTTMLYVHNNKDERHKKASAVSI